MRTAFFPPDSPDESNGYRVATRKTAAVSPEARRAYNAGWKAGQDASPDAVERADRRRAPREWYMGFFDAEGGLEKYHSLSLDESE